MNSFLKIFLACLLAIVVSCCGLFVLFFGFVAGISMLLEPSPVKMSSNSVLEITLSEPVTDKPLPLRTTDLYSLNFTESLILYEVVNNIELAKTDPNIDGIYLNLSPMLSVGMGNMEEIRNALLDFKQSGKFIVSYSDFYTQSSYYLSSVADKIFLNPAGELLWQGMASNVLFYKGTLDKLGIQPEIIRHGKFKSAVEPFMSESMSPENREQVSGLVGSIWGHIVSQVADTRSIDSTLLQNYATALTIRTPMAALQRGLIDSIGYRDQAVNYINEHTYGLHKADLIPLKEYINANRNYSTGKSRNRVAVIYAEGDIVDGRGAANQIGGDLLASYIDAARRDQRVKAIVLRVNSPGGSALASEVIWRAASMAQKEKPFVVSMGNYAASGGYYIACPADAIIANPTTVTGSIGVFGLLLNVGEGMKDKLGISVETVKTNPSADIQSAILFRPLTPSQRDYIQQGVERVYSTFIQHVADGRNLSVARVDELGEGRVWSGIDARENGLIDGYGGLRDAIGLAADRADLGYDYQVVVYPKPESTFERIVSVLNTEVKMKLPGNHATQVYDQYEQFIRNLNNLSAMQAMSPYRVEL